MGKMPVGRRLYCRTAVVAAAAATVVSLSMTFAVSEADAHGTCTPFAKVMYSNIGGPLGTTELAGYAEVGCAEYHDSIEVCVELQRQPVGSLASWAIVAEDCYFVTNPTMGGTTGTGLFSAWVPCSTGSWRAVGYGYATSTNGNHSFATVTPEELHIC